MTLESSQREELITALANHFSRPDVVQSALARLDRGDRSVFDALVALGGYAVTAPLTAYLTATGRVSAQANALETRLARLTGLGLVFTEPVPGQPPARDLRPGAQLFLSPVALEMAGVVEEDVAASFDMLPEGAEVRSMPADALLRDCYFYWSEVRDRPAAITARGLVAKRDVMRIAAALSLGDDGEIAGTEDHAGRVYFLRCLLMALGLLRQEGNALRAGETSLFRQSNAERAALAFAAWRDGDWWNELSRIEGLRVTTHRTPGRQGQPLIRAARALILSLLRALPAERWYSFEHLDGRARISRSSFILGSHAATPFMGGLVQGTTLDYTLTLEWSGRGSTWDAIEGRFLRAILLEPLYWMGVVELALDSGTPLAFRITRHGRHLLRGTSDAETAGLAEAEDAAESSGRVIVQPNFDVLVYEPVSPHTLAQLDRFATRQGTGNVLQYHLSRSSLYRAQQQGIGAATVIATLEEISGHELPQNIRYSLLDWQRQHERVTVHDGVALCQVADAEILDALLDAPPAGLEGMRRLAPDLVLLPPRSLGVLRSTLESRGYIAGLLKGPEDAEGATAGILRISPAGEIAVTGTLPSLYLHGTLCNFAEPMAVENPAEQISALYALTPNSMERAADDGLEVTAIAGWLESMSGAPLPPGLLDRLKSWAGHYGRVTLTRQVIVRLDEPQRLAELLTDPAVGPLLTPLAPGSGLATVADDQLDGLRQALAAKGISVDDRC